uniref:Putative secreted protein n=1 Tax=Anopheles darlingi TaxID=43151 RepID=A0A2M4DDX6_ANODA
MFMNMLCFLYKHLVPPGVLGDSMLHANAGCYAVNDRLTMTSHHKCKLNKASQKPGNPNWVQHELLKGFPHLGTYPTHAYTPHVWQNTSKSSYHLSSQSKEVSKGVGIQHISLHQPHQGAAHGNRRW